MSTDRVLSPRRRENRPKGPERAQARTSTGGEFIRKALNPCGNRDGIATHAANVDAHAELSRDCYQHRCRGREVNPFVRIKIDGFAPNRAAIAGRFTRSASRRRALRSHLAATDRAPRHRSVGGAGTHGRSDLASGPILRPRLRARRITPINDSIARDRPGPRAPRARDAKAIRDADRRRSEQTHYDSNVQLVATSDGAMTRGACPGLSRADARQPIEVSCAID